MAYKYLAFILVLGVFGVLIMSSFASANIFEWLKNSITGRAVGQVDFNITLGSGSAPQIYQVWNNSGENGPVTLTAGPTNTSIRINFSVSDADGAANIDIASARLNLSMPSEKLRRNMNCSRFQIDGNFANFTCLVNMSWYDNAGLWNISVNISDLSGNKATNVTTLLSVGSLTGFNTGPGNLTFGNPNAGSTNTSDTVNGVLMNNTGNVNIARGAIDINATDLLGETTNTQGIWASNFSVSNTTGSSIECNVGQGGLATQMNLTETSAYTVVTNASLDRGNFQYSNDTAQENLYVCILKIGTELSTQAYSTTQRGSWTLRGV